MDDRDEPIMDEESEISWREYLDEFISDVYPLFERYGFSRDTALTVWFINRMRNRLPEMPDGDDWEQGE